MFSNKTVLITGGTGTFGNAVLCRFLATDIGEIRIFSRDEKMRHDMRLAYVSNRKLKFTIGDVRRPESLFEAMSGGERHERGRDYYWMIRTGRRADGYGRSCRLQRLGYAPR